MRDDYVHNCLVILPAYNEQGSINHVIKGIRSLQSEIDIVVVNDGSWDATEQKVRSLGEQVISLPYNLGYGGAVQAGFKYAFAKGYRYVIQFDADGQHDPMDLEAIHCRLQQGYDIVIGSRFLANPNYDVGLFKGLAIKLFRTIITTATGYTITDPTSGLQGLSRHAFAHYATMGDYPEDYPDADTLIHMLLSGYKVIETPANIRPRFAGKSMHSGLRVFYYAVKMLISISVVILRDRFGLGGEQR